MLNINCYASICAIARDEPDIVDWAIYHFAIGFDKIWIFDNNSEVSLKEVLREYISLGLIDVVEFSLRDHQQLSAYAAFLSQYGHLTRWTAFIDIDEYINLKKHVDISEFLENYSEHPAVAVNWKIFGSNGHLIRPPKSIIEEYTTYISEHNLIKSIVQPSMTAGVSSPHHFIYKDGALGVNEHFIPVLGPHSYHTSEVIQINHYYFKSQQDFEAKMARGFATPVMNRDGYKMDEFYNQSSNPGTSDLSILRFFKKTNLYSRLGPKFIYEKIIEKANVNICDILEKASNLLLHKGEDQAIRLLKSALRYNSHPALYISLSKIYTLQNNIDQAFICLINGFKVAGTDFEKRNQLFRELAQLYARKGLPNQYRQIIKELDK